MIKQAKHSCCPPCLDFRLMEGWAMLPSKKVLLAYCLRKVSKPLKIFLSVAAVQNFRLQRGKKMTSATLWAFNKDKLNVALSVRGVSQPPNRLQSIFSTSDVLLLIILVSQERTNMIGTVT